MSASDRIRKQSVTGLVALVQRSSNHTIFTTKTSSLNKHFENVALRTAAGKKKKKSPAQYHRNRAAISSCFLQRKQEALPQRFMKYCS